MINKNKVEEIIELFHGLLDRKINRRNYKYYYLKDYLKIKNNNDYSIIKHYKGINIDIINSKGMLLDKAVHLDNSITLSVMLNVLSNLDIIEEYFIKSDVDKDVLEIVKVIRDHLKNNGKPSQEHLDYLVSTEPKGLGLSSGSQHILITLDKYFNCKELTSENIVRIIDTITDCCTKDVATAISIASNQLDSLNELGNNNYSLSDSQQANKIINEYRESYRILLEY